MSLFIAILLILLATLGLSFFGLSKIWMILGILLSAAALILMVLQKFVWKRPEKEKLISGIQIGLLFLSVITLMAATGEAAAGGYWDYRETLESMRKAYAADDDNKADGLLLEFLGTKDSKTAKKLTTDDYVGQVRGGNLADEQKDALLAARAEYLLGQEKPGEVKTLLDAMADKKSERYYKLYIAYLCLERSGLSQQEELYRELAGIYGEAADRYPDEYEFQFGAGLANLQAGNYNVAELYLEGARSLTADTATVDLARALLRYYNGDIKTAGLYLEDVKTLVAKGYGPDTIQEGIEELQGLLDAADENEKTGGKTQ